MIISAVLSGLPAFRIIDVIDICFVAFLFYYLYKLLKGTNAVSIFIGFLLIFFSWKVVTFLEMKLLSEIIGQFISVGVIALVVIFQTEIRQFLLRLGSHSLKKGYLNRLFAKTKSEKIKLDITPIVQACGHMSQTLTGALIVICKSNPLTNIIQTGEVFNSQISSQLLETIFFKNTPLHDGALIIAEGEIKAARCILPVSNNQSIPVSMGLRHRSAIGITEQTDAISIIVSEQTGKISVAKQGKVTQGLTLTELQQYLNNEFNEETTA
ncbi:MAG: diadenylate cyclase CdaA [Bacteroidales bacterium]|nr:diadenylate cyclase CdaA [Bacteroidales bacterium]MBO7179912.1 diadenylate cyclase CdaA [Bacteroidales bacterium]MBQ2386661.1 diadenylate cyclase CdaA [Bacteroidales bacterium]MEE0900583.1 diadenylate cyclase CdaA [Bacteroidales bacterium]MEE0910679.1 diadenylate cyclase CdaA [Bacteroidales bacterium]